VFFYELPAERIAQRPLGYTAARSDARLLHAVASRTAGDLSINDRAFAALPSVLSSNDVLVLNDTKVRPARVFAELESTGREVELLFTDEGSSGEWQAIARPMKKVRAGDRLHISSQLVAEVIGRTEDQRRLRIRFPESDAVQEQLHDSGVMPIPPYIRRGRADFSDESLYQTVFAKELGSLAAPTASLHFTEQVLQELREAGIGIVYLTHHVGTGSVSPVSEQLLENHRMDSEFYRIPLESRASLRAAREEGRRVIAVGTTVVRALESEYLSGDGACRAEDSGFIETSLFIYPGHEFQGVDAMITNFHQPSSTHLQLVAAFFEESHLEKVYQHALADSSYRFLTYGDSSFLEFA